MKEEWDENGTTRRAELEIEARMQHHRWYRRWSWVASQTKYVMAMVFGGLISSLMYWVSDGDRYLIVRNQAIAIAVLVGVLALIAVVRWLVSDQHRAPLVVDLCWVAVYYFVELFAGSVLSSLFGLIWVFGTVEHLEGSVLLIVSIACVGALLMLIVDALARRSVIRTDGQSASRRGVYKLPQVSAEHLSLFQQRNNEKTVLASLVAHR